MRFMGFMIFSFPVGVICANGGSVGRFAPDMVRASISIQRMALPFHCYHTAYGNVEVTKVTGVTGARDRPQVSLFRCELPVASPLGAPGFPCAKQIRRLTDLRAGDVEVIARQNAGVEAPVGAVYRATAETGSFASS
ncbi:hypothetical protein [Streptomyces fodineus]|uniref:hypothetical protein n=1 Tax=Streptomyces fodineus TaxID=1904616 RepID=UPI00131ACB35|nr:hypothetical protein [Streptomyces fodineus]